MGFESLRWICELFIARHCEMKSAAEKTGRAVCTRDHLINGSNTSFIFRFLLKPWVIDDDDNHRNSLMLSAEFLMYSG
jgi:hypothetical protein